METSAAKEIKAKARRRDGRAVCRDQGSGHCSEVSRGQCRHRLSVQFSSVQSLSHVRPFPTPWIAARQASLSTNSRSLLKLMSIESVMPSNHLILCLPLLLLPSIFPSTRVFSNEYVFCIGGQSIGVSGLPSVLLMNIQN